MVAQTHSERIKAFPNANYDTNYKRQEADEEHYYEVHVLDINSRDICRIEEYVLEQNAEEAVEHRKGEPAGIRAKLIEVNQDE